MSPTSDAQTLSIAEVTHVPVLHFLRKTFWSLAHTSRHGDPSPTLWSLVLPYSVDVMGPALCSEHKMEVRVQPPTSPRRVPTFVAPVLLASLSELSHPGSKQT